MSSNNSPEISVIMSVYNAEAFLEEAIQSILDQTFKNFEFIIIDDASTDHSLEIISSFDDERIVFIRNEKNLGLTKSLNKAISYARGKYIARMDADDISVLERLEKQVGLMESNPHIDICGTWYETFGIKEYIQKLPITHEEIKASLLFFSPIAHPSVLMKKSIFDTYSYPQEFLKAQDYALWTLLIDKYTFENIPEPLLKYRMHIEQITEKNATEQTKFAQKASNVFLKKCNMQRYENVHYKIWGKESILLDELEKHLQYLLVKNKEEHCFDEQILSGILFEQWWMCMNTQSRYTFSLLKAFYNSDLYLPGRLGFKNHFKFIVKAFIGYKRY